MAPPTWSTITAVIAFLRARFVNFRFFSKFSGNFSTDEGEDPVACNHRGSETPECVWEENVPGVRWSPNRPRYAPINPRFGSILRRTHYEGIHRDKEIGLSN